MTSWLVVLLVFFGGEPLALRVLGAQYELLRSLAAERRRLTQELEDLRARA